MNLFDEIIEKLRKIPDSADVIEELERARDSFADPTCEEAQKVAMDIFRRAIDAKKAQLEAEDDDDDDEKIVVSDEEKVMLEAAVETVKGILDKRIKSKYEVEKRADDMYVITFEPRYEFCRLSVEVYVEAAPLVCFIRINLPVVVDPIYSYIVSERLAEMNRKSSRYGTYAINPRNGTIECRYRMRYDGGLNAEVFSTALFNSMYDADDHFMELRRLSVGKLKKDKISEILKKMKDLVSDIEA